MDYELISSKQNKLIKRIKSLYKKKYRDLENLFVVEGLRSVSLVCENKPMNIKYILTTEAYLLKIDFDYDKEKLFICTEEVFDSITEITNAQGILAVCEKNHLSIEDILKQEEIFLLICENIQDPGNAGTLIRTTDSVGADAIVFTKGSVDIYNPKVVRSTAGSILNVKVFESFESEEIIDICKKNNIYTYGTTLETSENHFDVEYSSRLGIFLGNEGNGLNKKTQDMLDYKIKIEMCGEAESLNVGVAGSVVAYEVLRQKRKGGI